MSSLYDSSRPIKPDHGASTAFRDARERRRSERRNTSQSNKRYIPHNGATCGNDLCDSPEISKDEELCPGPDNLELCYRCYKRFKIARRRARDAQREMTDDWRRPKRRRPLSQTIPETTPVEAPQRPVTAVLKTPDTEYSDLDLSTPDLKTGSGREVNTYGNKPPQYEARGRGSRKQASPRVAQISDPEKSPGRHSVSTSSLEEFERRTSRSPRKHRSGLGRAERRHSRNEHTRDASTHEDAEFYKYGRMEENGYHDRRDDNNRRCGCCSMWSRRRKCVVFSLITLSIIILIMIIAVAATLSRKRGFNYVPSTAQVNNTEAFSSGGATRKSVNDTNDTNDSIGAGTDTYTYYHGNASNFPNQTQWVTFSDMWAANLDTFKYSCGWLQRGDNNTPEMIRDIYDAIQDRANASLVDHRIILATIIQETNGCPLVPHTTSSGGTRNPGLMQSHDGHAYDAKHSRLSILQMVQDGTQGTEKGWGLVDNLNTYGNPYKAMRGYNSGYVPESGNLSEQAGATACYVSDIANRLTGWVRAKTKCPDDAH
ncbi:hypothetical protein P171DRAFT_429267 [Karstenula rhodostoma CBS 690.94]|uniref:Transglycosylase SLT domain-containing protein n=1 Tax=Karstenula rhodostoma CBS 690.94 TaxID=1392251 RepID=A0A9P4PNU9_9PLEO|nr:hypothetical protein P171DRAFT_429267 [Karstenula rhodostoma CBS 690.94]